MIPTEHTEKMQYLRKAVRPVKVEAICDCGNPLEFTGRMLLTSPPKYVYECNVCKERCRLDEVYPRIEYEEYN